jgi:hypothetical protein
VPSPPRRGHNALAVTAIVILILVAAGYGAYHVVQRLIAAPPPPPGCAAGTAAQNVSLDIDQAAIAATIAGVAARHHLPEQALVIAYATALQESDLQNLHYGDRDSVGVFQQRPSQGWGTTANLENPVYATTKFFAALVEVPDYTKIPVAVAAQDVQRSADGSAYGQFTYVAGLLAGDFTGNPPREVWCWYTPAATAESGLTGAKRGLEQTFGPAARVTVLNGSLVVTPGEPSMAWTLANWLVTNASQYRISQVRYAGYAWTAAVDSMGWQPATDPSDGTIVAGLTASRHTVGSKGRRQEFTRDLHHRAALR